MNPIKSILSAEQKIISAEILNYINAASSILLHCHPSPDPDSLGSTLATKYALESLGKKVTIIAGDSKIPQAFMHFPGATQIINQNYFETNLSDFDLFIVLDSGSLNMISRKGEVVFPPASNMNLKTIVIDHHASNTGYGDINLVATQYPSTTEILFDLFQEWGILSPSLIPTNSSVSIQNSPLKEIAANLYVGLVTDGGSFRYGRITDHSFYMAEVLYKLNPDILKVIEILENSASSKSVDYLALALTQKKVFKSEENVSKGSFILSYISYEDIVREGFTSDDLSGNPVCHILKSVTGNNVVALMVEEKPGEVKISLRTRDQVEFDVSKVAIALGGGGHKAAAGALVRKPMQEALEIVADTIKNILFS